MEVLGKANKYTLDTELINGLIDIVNYKDQHGFVLLPDGNKTTDLGLYFDCWYFYWLGLNSENKDIELNFDNINIDTI